jgi:isopenicillin N synthase-like dioxygenase
MSHDQGIPVLDLSTARQPYGSFSPEFIEQLRYATHNVGFFQITGYGAAPGQAEQLLDTIRRFFALPLEERMKLRLHPDGHRGDPGQGGRARTN